MQLFCETHAAEFSLLQLDAATLNQLMQGQFQAQMRTYRANFPDARFDIIQLESRPIGRVVVDRDGDVIHLIDMALMSGARNRGIGTAVIGRLIEESRGDGIPVHLTVSSVNEAAMRLYLRLGFVVIENGPLHIRTQWQV